MKYIDTFIAIKDCPKCLGSGVEHGSSSITSWIHSCSMCHGEKQLSRVINYDELPDILSSLVSSGQKIILSGGEQVYLMGGICTGPRDQWLQSHTWQEVFSEPFPAT